MRVKILFIILIVFFAFRGNATDVKDLDKVRENHFTNNATFDTLFVKECMKSDNKFVARYAKGLLGAYYIENLNVNGERYWLDLGLSKDKWFQESSTINEEMLLFDDMFRICAVYKKYYFFDKILNLFYDTKLNIAQQPYNLYIEFKTGNIYNFLISQTSYKKFFIDKADPFEQINYKVKERILFNISAINFSNFDSSYMKNFILKLKNFSKYKVDSSSSFEKILFKLSILNYNNDSISADSIAFINNNKIVNDEYFTPFIASFEIENLPLIESVKDILLSQISKRYNFVISNYLRIDDHLNLVLDYRLKSVQNSTYISNIIINKFNKSIDENEINILIITINKCDSILRMSRELSEPSWLWEKFNIIENIGNTSNNIFNQLQIKYSNKPIPKLYSNFSSINNNIKKHDYYKCVDNANIFHSLNDFVSYFIIKSDKEIELDTSQINRVDSIFILIKYIKSVNYIFYKGDTYAKWLIDLQLQKYILLLKRFLYIKKEFKLFEQVCKIDDSYFNGVKNENFPEEVTVSTSMMRYLAFKASSTKEELSYFDSLYVSTYNKELAKKDSILPAFKNIYFQSFTRDIILDIYSRKSINDSVCASLLVMNDILMNISNEGITNLNIYENYYENECLINRYKNSYFCIDNSRLNTSRYSNLNTNINMEIVNLFNNSDSIKNRIDTTRKNLFYLIYDDISYKNANLMSIYEIENIKNFTLFGGYSFDKIRQVAKLCSLDTLRSIFNFDVTKSNRFYNNTNYFVSDLEKKSLQLYDIILKPFEKYLDTTSFYNLIFPSSLNSIPLDFIYAKKNGNLINFLEFSSMYRAAKKISSHVLKMNDTAAIFTNFIYNDAYCNLTNSTNIGTRGGISPLTYSIAEQEVISNRIPTVKFEKLQASKEQFIVTTLVGRYPILHLITHGSYIPNNTKSNNDLSFPTNPNERQLLLFSSDSSRKTNRNNIMTAYETRYFENLSKIKLIFLSACETGSSEVNDYSNSGYQGFVNNFLERGVKSVIATRWKVSDKYSVDFANKYYENLTLLKDFQRAFFETKKYFFNNNTPPYLWTSYVFVQ